MKSTMPEISLLQKLLFVIADHPLPEKVFTDHERIETAELFGYADARMLVYLRETHGLPLADAAVRVKKLGLKIDFQGLRLELERIGKKPQTIDSELNEVRFFMERAA